MDEELIIQLGTMLVVGGWWIWMGILLIKIVKQTDPKNER
jgi:hypothetical protein